MHARDTQNLAQRHPFPNMRLRAKAQPCAAKQCQNCRCDVSGQLQVKHAVWHCPWQPMQLCVKGVAMQHTVVTPPPRCRPCLRVQKREARGQKQSPPKQRYPLYAC